jgi:hypothetical protein
MGANGFAFVPNPCRVPKHGRLVVEPAGKPGWKLLRLLHPACRRDAQSDQESIAPNRCGLEIPVVVLSTKEGPSCSRSRRTQGKE